MTTGIKKGKTDKVMFGTQSYNACGEMYKDGGNTIARKTNMGAIMGVHEKNWVYAKVIKKGMKTPYEAMTERKVLAKNFRDEEGAVIIGPRNFLTNPVKVGRVGKGTTFAGPIPFQGDDFYAATKIATKDREYHESKVQEKPFSQMSRRLRGGVFNKDSVVYDVLDDIKWKPRKMTAQPTCEHERAFRPANPAKKGANSTINRFPKYMENPGKQITRVRPVEGEDPPPRFKMTTNSYSRPTPSIATNMRNMKSSFPSVFRK